MAGINGTFLFIPPTDEQNAAIGRPTNTVHITAGSIQPGAGLTVFNQHMTIKVSNASRAKPGTKLPIARMISESGTRNNYAFATNVDGLSGVLGNEMVAQHFRFDEGGEVRCGTSAESAAQDGQTQDAAVEPPPVGQRVPESPIVHVSGGDPPTHDTTPTQGGQGEDRSVTNGAEPPAPQSESKSDAGSSNVSASQGTSWEMFDRLFPLMDPEARYELIRQATPAHREHMLNRLPPDELVKVMDRLFAEPLPS